MTADEINLLWIDTLKYADPTAGNAHIRFARALLAQPKQTAPKITAYLTHNDDADMLFFDKAEAYQYCDDDSEPEPLVLLSDMSIAQPEQTATDKLLQIIAAAYQIAGACDIPAHILDVLANPEQATQGQIDAMLPFVRPAEPAEPDDLTLVYMCGFSDGKKAAQPASERNFCPRCGKRLGGVDDVHTCTAPVQKANS